VAGLGVQVLFGFMLSLPFTTRFVKLGPAQRDLYVASLLLAAISTALLVAPVAYHRLVFRQHQKERLVKDANVMALGGLAAVALAISGAVLLVVSYVDTGWPVVVISVFVVWPVRRPVVRAAARPAALAVPAVNSGERQIREVGPSGGSASRGRGYNALAPAG